MKYEILHEIPGRMRVRCLGFHVTGQVARAIGELLSLQDGIVAASLNPRTGNLLVVYSRVMPRGHLLALLDVMESEDWDGFGLTPLAGPPPLFDVTVSAMMREAFLLGLKLLLLPAPVRYALILLEALPIVGKGLVSLARGRADIAVLDAAAVSIMAARSEFGALRAILWMFGAADALGGWTREQSRSNLAAALALEVDSVWTRTPRGDRKRALADVGPDDLVIIQTGSVIPVDGVVAEGEALVNQSMLTGESEATHKTPGHSVFAGAVVDEGQLVIRVTKAAGETRLRNIIDFIEESEALKAGVQSDAEHLADGIVPYSLLLALTVLVVTRNPARASAVLMVDYSCAIRISTPLTILKAIQEGVQNGVLIKGGKYLEILADADALVIDKTGTLTMARPHVHEVVGFAGWTPREVLRTAACIEEHFPHPVGRAVVKEAERQTLRHRERHAKPEYILAHGISSRLDGKEILVGSAHFIFDDMGVAWTDEALATARNEADRGRSLLYMAHDRRLVGVLAVEDPIRPDAAATLSGLSADGVGDIHMLTGDGERTARAVADRLGIKDHRSGMLPVEKAAFINRLKAKGRKVVFVGDGVNDSPALSAASVGVSLKDGADIAKEVAGVVLVDGRLSDLLVGRRLSRLALNRVASQFGVIMGLNSLLIALGLFGALTPRLAAIFHNLGTLLVTANSIQQLLPDASEKTISMPLPDGDRVRGGSPKEAPLHDGAWRKRIPS